MNHLLNNNGKASSVPAGFVWGGVVSLTATVVFSTILAWLIIGEKVQQSQLGYGIMAILPVAAFLGAKTAFAKIQRRRLLVCAGAGVVYFGMLLSATALFFGGQYSGVGETGLMIFCGCLLAFLLKKPAGNKVGTAKIKTRYC